MVYNRDIDWDTAIWLTAEITAPSSIGVGTLDTQRLLELNICLIKQNQTLAKEAGQTQKQIDKIDRTLKWTRRFVLALGTGVVSYIVPQLLSLLHSLGVI